MTPHHARPSRLRIAALAPVLAASILACDGGDDTAPADELITSALRIVVSSGASLRGVQLDMAHGPQLTVLDVTPTGGFAGGTCAENVEDGRVRLSCVSNTDVATPFSAWTISVRHSSAVDPLDAVTSVACAGSGPTGSAVAVTCDVE